MRVASGVGSTHDGAMDGPGLSPGGVGRACWALLAALVMACDGSGCSEAVSPSPSTPAVEPEVAETAQDEPLEPSDDDHGLPGLDGDGNDSPSGQWRAVLESPGGELPFGLDIGGGAATIVNGDERATVGLVAGGTHLLFSFDVYDAEIGAQLDELGTSMQGEWRKTTPKGQVTLPFRAYRGQRRRFGPAHRDALPDPEDAKGVDSVAGEWEVTFTDDGGDFKAVGKFRQDGEDVTGTFLTATGDYRFLEGEYRRGLLRLSAFDGAHALLFHARASEDGTLSGDYWSGAHYHATWTATPMGSQAVEDVLPDPYSQVRVTDPSGRLQFAFEDLEGNVVSSSDFRRKPLIVEIFGTWCPNCGDASRLLGELYRRYHDRGLEIVGVAFEYTGDETRDRRMVRRYKAHHGIEYPLLLGGISDKHEATEAFRGLSDLKSYPTFLFIGRDGRVRRIYSGFAGPGTGEHYDALVKELDEAAASLLGR